MKTIITSILILNSWGLTFGQGFSTFSTANSNAKYFASNNGLFFHNPILNPGAGYLVPKDSLTGAIFAMSFMAVGEDVNGQLKGAVAKYVTSDFSAGPYLPNAANYNSASYTNRYFSSIWSMAKSQVDYHIAHWADQGYVVSPMITSWPGNGNTGNGESSLLAPFHDQDGDQVYEPQAGDYPLIRGDYAVYTIVNDGKVVHPSGISPAGIEVHMMFYQYDSLPDEAVRNTVFFQTTIFNRGTQALNHFHAGHLIDFDLGNPEDDYIGTETNRHLAYVYNGDSYDDFFLGNNGYGSNPPAAGILNLDGSLSSHILLQHPDSLNSASSYYRVLSGLLPDGSPLLNGNNLPTTYIYDDLDPTTGWNEFMGVGNAPGERLTVTGHGEVVFHPGEVLCYNNAAIFARSYSGGLVASADSLFQVADHIQNFYNAQNFHCESQFLGIQEQQELSFSLYPNPSRDYIQIAGITSGTFRVLNPEGKEVLSGVLETAIQLDALKSGFYILEITSGGKHGRKSFVKE